MKFTLNYNLLAIVFSMAISALSAQTPISEATRTAKVWPQYPGCDSSMAGCSKSKLTEFITSNLVIPAEAKKEGLGGVVMVEFVIEKNGTIGEVRTLHDPGFGLGTAAVNVVSQMKEKKIKWSPALEKGKRVPFRYMTPVSFNLSRPDEEPQQSTTATHTKPAVYDVVEVMPMYAGCTSSPGDTIDCTYMHILKHFQTNLAYPDTALKVGTEGPVIVEFIIDEKGNVTKPLIKSGLGYGCDEEALRVIMMMPTWQPGRENGVAVPVRMVMPILFKIPKPNTE